MRRPRPRELHLPLRHGLGFLADWDHFAQDVAGEVRALIQRRRTHDVPIRKSSKPVALAQAVPFGNLRIHIRFQALINAVADIDRVSIRGLRLVAGEQALCPFIRTVERENMLRISGRLQADIHLLRRSGRGGGGRSRYQLVGIRVGRRCRNQLEAPCPVRRKLVGVGVARRSRYDLKSRSAGGGVRANLVYSGLGGGSRSGSTGLRHPRSDRKAHTEESG